MAVAMFFLFSSLVILFGLGFSVMTLRHHQRIEKEARRNLLLKSASESTEV